MKKLLILEWIQRLISEDEDYYRNGLLMRGETIVSKHGIFRYIILIRFTPLLQNLRKMYTWLFAALPRRDISF